MALGKDIMYVLIIALLIFVSWPYDVSFEVPTEEVPIAMIITSPPQLTFLTETFFFKEQVQYTRDIDGMQWLTMFIISLGAGIGLTYITKRLKPLWVQAIPTALVLLFLWWLNIQVFFHISGMYMTGPMLFIGLPVMLILLYGFCFLIMFWLSKTDFFEDVPV